MRNTKRRAEKENPNNVGEKLAYECNNQTSHISIRLEPSVDIHSFSQLIAFASRNIPPPPSPHYEVISHRRDKSFLSLGATILSLIGKYSQDDLSIQ